MKNNLLLDLYTRFINSSWTSDTLPLEYLLRYQAELTSKNVSLLHFSNHHSSDSFYHRVYHSVELLSRNNEVLLLTLFHLFCWYFSLLYRFKKQHQNRPHFFLLYLTCLIKNQSAVAFQAVLIALLFP